MNETLDADRKRGRSDDDDLPFAIAWRADRIMKLSPSYLVRFGLETEVKWLQPRSRERVRS
jgi:hypothetical protein